MNNRLLIIGSTTLDENIVNGRHFHKPGGVPVYSGLTWHRLGARPVIVSNIAETDSRIQSFFSDRGISIHSSHTEHTTRFINTCQGDLRVQHMPDAAAPVITGQITAVWEGITHIHLGPLHPDDLEADIYRLDFGNRQVTLDIQGLTRTVKDGTVTPSAAPVLADALKAADIVKADETELAMACEALNMTADAMMNQYQIREIVATRGEAGGIVYTPSDAWTFSSRPKARIVDTTGAGDVFFAAYCFARFIERKTIRAACTFAADIAATHIEGRWIPENLLITQTQDIS